VGLRLIVDVRVPLLGQLAEGALISASPALRLTPVIS
jgi:hypothetical protein